MTERYREDPDVSVVMSTYNDEDLLPDALESVLTQEGLSLEVIVVNDGSTDGTGDLLDEWARRDPRLRVVHRENDGLTTALILGCEMARGRYIARQDADDRSLPGRFARQVALAEEDPRNVVVSCWCRYVDLEGNELTVIERPYEPEVATRRFWEDREGPPAHGTVLFRRDVYEKVGGYRAPFYYGQDSDLWLRMVEHGRIAYVQDILYEYRISAEQISQARRPLQRRFGELGQAARRAREKGGSETTILEEATRLREQVIREHGVTHESSDPVSASRSFYYMGASVETKDSALARSYLWRALRRNPLHLKAWLRLGVNLLTQPFRAGKN